MNSAVLAVAGSRKTQSIVDSCANGARDRRRLVISYTLSGQRDLERRLAAACEPTCVPEVSGWYSFLLRHWVKPFLPLKYPGRRLSGLNFDGEPVKNSRGIVIAKGAERYLDSDSRAYKRFLSKLAIDVAEVAGGTVVSRIGRIYDEIYFDEVQDMTGYDLDILERLLSSACSIRLVGDIRQSVFDTNPQDPRHRKYRGIKMLDWFREQASAGRLELSFSSDTWRSVQPIATFSDSIFDPALGFPQTMSRQSAVSAHDGVFAVATRHLDEYLDAYDPVCLRASVSTSVPDGVEAINFGVSKGRTYDRVVIFPTAGMRSFVVNGTLLAPKAACGLYVGVSRAVHSVAFVMDRPDRSSLPVWVPHGST